MHNQTSAPVDFLKRLVNTEALPGSEGELASIVLEELRTLGFSEVHRDEVGNVLGKAPGRGSSPGLFFNTHLDHVDVGDHGRWPHPPYGAETSGGYLHGRGTVDIKGPLAAQVYAAARFLERPAAGDVWVTGVVQEEVGGVGARHLAPRLAELSLGSMVSGQPSPKHSPIVIVGEPSSNQLRRGHRGRIEVVVSFYGVSAHASAPHRAVNPLFSAAKFLEQLDRIAITKHQELGASTIAPTLLATDQTSANVVPSEVHQTLDIRTVPGQDTAALVCEINALASTIAEEKRREIGCSPGHLRAEVLVPTYPLLTYTGLERPIPADNPPYLLQQDHPALEVAQRAVANPKHESQSSSDVDVWAFATDGGHFFAAGATPIGLAPGDESLAHTVNERIFLEEFADGIELNEAVARALSEWQVVDSSN